MRRILLAGGQNSRRFRQDEKAEPIGSRLAIIYHFPRRMNATGDLH